jgi:hypothetical protein
MKKLIQSTMITIAIAIAETQVEGLNRLEMGITLLSTVFPESYSLEQPKSF